MDHTDTDGGTIRLTFNGDSVIADIDERLESVNRRHGTGFALMRFRRPARDSSGRWNCRFQLPTLVTRYGEVERDHGLPTRRMFDVRYIRAQVAHNRVRHSARLRLERHGDDAPRLVAADMLAAAEGVLDLGDAADARLLVEEGGDRAMPHLHALVEEHSGIVFPVATDCTVEITVSGAGEGNAGNDGEDAAGPTMDILVCPPRAPHAHRSTVYDRYFDVPSTIGDDEVLARLSDDSALLRREVLERDGERYRIVRDAVDALRADNPPDARDGREWTPDMDD
ncbi:hypothetical protein [Bifidobacterium parmae]|uniref:Uncharacterized protein n=1 Tax=Bifidobacterium parmae TaxID=361854 RepID=A0A2N5J4M5_9BIFI|nr:hypothetical protein [Bifidobacterium parmae]PLS29175.1 hypothetical protein Uis4E_0753 [Bifidobacterium parmae]